LGDGKESGLPIYLGEPYRRVSFAGLADLCTRIGNDTRRVVMDEETRRQVAIFRFGVIHDFVGGVRLWTMGKGSGW
jgi:hypothetical protein